MERMTREELKKRGGLIVEDGPGPAAPAQKMTRAELEAAGGQMVDAPPTNGQVPDVKEPGDWKTSGLSNNPEDTFMLNALDSASIVGLPTTLALKDALTGDAKDGDFRTRYGKAKTFYEQGMERLHKHNAPAATAGQFATVLTPGGAGKAGARILPTIARGAAIGTASGAARGPSKLVEEGDWKGTLTDAGVGGAAGGLLSGGGALVGKAVEAGGNLARKGMSKVLAEVGRRTKSDIAKARNMGGQGAGAVENAWNANAMANAGPGGVVPGLAHRDPAQVARNLARRKGNIENVLDKEGALFKKHGPLLRPSTRELNAKNTENVAKESTGLLLKTIQTAGMGFAGYKAAEAAGIDPRIGAAVGGAGGLYAVRKLSQNATSHPATLKRLMALRPIGQALARMGGKAGSTPQNVGAVVYALRDNPEVKRVLKEYEASSPDQR